MDPDILIQIISLVIFVFLSGFFSSCETAFSSLNRVRIKALAEEGHKRAAKCDRILEKDAKMLSTILIGNNIVNISASALATTLAIRVSMPVGIMTGVLTFVVLMFGEITPKTIALTHGERLAFAYCNILIVLMAVFTPVIFVVDIFAKCVFWILRIDSSKREQTMTETELKNYVEVSHEDGVTSSNERELIFNVFDFSDSYAKDIMIPRINMTAVQDTATYDELMQVFRENMYTRIPVYTGDPDNIIGLINIKDFILCEDKDKFKVTDILREAHYTHELKRTNRLLEEMRQLSLNIAFVIDEYGACVGMITLEDLLEEIVGEIRDEYDADEEELIQKLGEDSYFIEGSMKIDDVNDALGIDLASEDYDSIGGLIIEKLERLPERGDSVVLDNGYELTAADVDQNRIMKVCLKVTKPEEETEEKDAD